jgi:hypothetical protein
MAATHSPTPVRGTQSFVRTLTLCWQRPSVTALEIAWRWLYGIPALSVSVYFGRDILSAHTAGTMSLGALGLDKQLLADPVGALTADPMGAVGKFTGALAVLLPDVRHVALWLVPVLVAVWIAASSFGRTVALRRADPALTSRTGTLIVLQTIRMAALVASFALWFRCLDASANFAIEAPIRAGNEPNLVGYCAMIIVSTLVLFVLWAAVSWVFSIAPLLAMLRNLDARSSLRQALALGQLKSKLVEINLVMGIVKIALIVLAMVFSATPLPFESVTTPEFLAWWWAGVTLVYLVATDFFHVARLIGYLDLWRAYQQ